MALSVDSLKSKLKTVPQFNADVATFAQQFSTQYALYAAECETGMPMGGALTKIIPTSLVVTNLSAPLSVLSSTSSSSDKAKDFAKAMSDGIKAYWATAQFGIPTNIPGAILLPPTELLATMPKNDAIEATSESINTYTGNITADVEKLPSVITVAAAGASAAVLTSLMSSLSANINSIKTCLSDITLKTNVIPSPVTNTSDFSAIGSALNDIPSSVGSMTTSLSSMISSIATFKSAVSAAIAASVSAATLPITDDIATQLKSIGDAVTSGIANLVAPKPQKISLQTALEKGFLNTTGEFIVQMELLAEILHACTKTGTTSGTNNTIPTAPVPFVSILGDPSDVSAINIKGS